MPRQLVAAIVAFAGLGAGGLAAAPAGAAVFAEEPSSPHATTGDYALGLVTGDVDEDGRVDVVTSGGPQGHMDVLLRGSGADFTRSGPALITERAPTSSIALGDIDGDGHLDALSASFPPDVFGFPPALYAFLGRGDGRFDAAPGSGFDPTAGAREFNTAGIAAADLDGDGRAEIVLAGGRGDNVRIFDADATGRIATAATATYPTTARASGVTIADVDGDGDRDIVVGAHFRLNVFLNDGTGRFVAAPGGAVLHGGTQATVLGVVDLNRDGHPDVVVGHSVSDDATVMLGDGTGRFTAGTTVSVPANASLQGIAVGDVAGDDNPDVMLADQDGSRLFVFLGDGTGALAPAPGSPMALGYEPTDLALMDVTGDRKLDLLVADSDNPRMRVLENQAQPRVGYSPGPVDFGPVLRGATSSTRTVTVRNTGERPLTLDDVRTSDPAFAVTRQTCEAASPLAIGASCQVDVRWSPQHSGETVGGLLMTTNSATTTARLGLRGVVPTATVTVTGAGSGGGTVTSDPAGIACTTGSPTGCAAPFDRGASVTLTAVPATGSRFAGFTGSGTSTCGTDPSCVVPVDPARVVTATFVARRTLAVATDGSGAGTVTGDPGSIACTTGSTDDCGTTQDDGTWVTLTAVPAAGSRFAGFHGDGTEACTGTTCVVTLDRAREVRATFVALRVLTVDTEGSGSGLVTDDSGGLSCRTGSATGCATTRDLGRAVTLTAAPDPGSRFDGFSGPGTEACDGTICTVTLDEARLVSATFVVIPPVVPDVPAPVAPVGVAPSAVVPVVPVLPAAPARIRVLGATTSDRGRTVRVRVRAFEPGTFAAVATHDGPSRATTRANPSLRPGPSRIVHARLARRSAARAGLYTLVLRRTAAAAGVRYAGRSILLRVTVRLTTADGRVVARRTNVRVRLRG